MRIGTSKCAKASFHAGGLVASEGFSLKDSMILWVMGVVSTLALVRRCCMLG